MAGLIPLLSKYLPVPLALKALEKKFPKISSFITNAGAAGYGTDAALDFLRQKFGQGGEQQRLESSQNLRPDEQASLQELKQARAPADVLQKGIGLATGLGAGIASLPRNNVSDQQQPQGPLQGVEEAISVAKQRSDTFKKMGAYPEDLEAERKKSLPKAPESLAQLPAKLGGGIPIVSQRVQQKPSSAQPAASQMDPIKKFFSQYPEIENAIDQKTKEGKGLREAASEVKQSKLFRGIVDKIEQKMGQSFEDLLEQLFGAPAQGQQQSPKQTGPSKQQQQLIGIIQQIKQIRGQR